MHNAFRCFHQRRMMIKAPSAADTPAGTTGAVQGRNCLRAELLSAISDILGLRCVNPLWFANLLLSVIMGRSIVGRGAHQVQKPPPSSDNCSVLRRTDASNAEPSP